MQRHPALLKSVGSADTHLLCGDKTTSDIYCMGGRGHDHNLRTNAWGAAGYISPQARQGGAG